MASMTCLWNTILILLWQFLSYFLWHSLWHLYHDMMCPENQTHKPAVSVIAFYYFFTFSIDRSQVAEPFVNKRVHKATCCPSSVSLFSQKHLRPFQINTILIFFFFTFFFLKEKKSNWEYSITDICLKKLTRIRQSIGLLSRSGNEASLLHGTTAPHRGGGITKLQTLTKVSEHEDEILQTACMTDLSLSLFFGS